MLLNFLKGILIGLLFGVPVGAVGTMTVRNTLSGGIKAGLLTGLGSSVADCLYAIVGVFGLTVISDFLLNYQNAINLIGGTFIVLMGLRLLVKKHNGIVENANKNDSKNQLLDGSSKEWLSIKLFLSSFIVGITNPAAILTFLFAFSYFEIKSVSFEESIFKGIFRGISLVFGVFFGTYFWWTLLSFAINWIYKKSSKNGKIDFGTANIVFGIILLGFGLFVIVKGIRGFIE